jgi:hypothetical protein
VKVDIFLGIISKLIEAKKNEIISSGGGVNNLVQVGPHHFVFFNSLASTQFQISRHPIRVISVVSEQ